MWILKKQNHQRWVDLNSRLLTLGYQRFIIRLRMFTQIYIFINTIKKIEPKQKFISSIKSCIKYCTLCML